MVSVVYCPPVVFVLSFPSLMKEAQSNVRINAWKVVNCLIFKVVFRRLPTMPKSETWLTEICFRCVSVSNVLCRSCAPYVMFVPHVLSMRHLCLPCCFLTFWFCAWNCGYTLAIVLWFRHVLRFQQWLLEFVVCLVGRFSKKKAAQVQNICWNKKKLRNYWSLTVHSHVQGDPEGNRESKYLTFESYRP